MQAKLLTPGEHAGSLRIFRRGLIVATFGLGLFQLLIDASALNITVVAMCMAAFTIACASLLQVRNCSGGAPLTATAILLCVAANSVVPMLGTLIDGNPVVTTLQQPELVYFHRLVFTLVLLAAHLLLLRTSLSKMKNSLGRGFDRFRIRVMLRPESIFWIGAISCTLNLARIFVLPPGSVGQKILEAFGFGMLIPYVLLSPPYFVWLRARKNYQLGLMVLYFGGIAMGVTSRMSFIAPLATAVAANLAALIAGYSRVDRRSLPTALVVLTVMVGALGVMKDVSNAILVERAFRDQRTWEENIEATWRAFQDKEALRAMDELMSDKGIGAEIGTWEENYIGNPFLARFTSIKIDDNLLLRSSALSDSAVEVVRQSTYDRIWALIPDPMLPLFGVTLNKEAVLGSSIGDVMHGLASGTRIEGGMKTGSMLAHGYALHGWAYPLVLLLLLLPFFLIMQTLALPANSRGRTFGASSFALVYAFPLFIAFGFDGWHTIVAAMTRNVWQTVFAYAVLLYLVRFVPKSHRTHPMHGAGIRHPV